MGPVALDEVAQGLCMAVGFEEKTFARGALSKKGTTAAAGEVAVGGEVQRR